MSRCLLIPALVATLVHCGDSGGPGLPNDVGVAGDGNLAMVLESIRDATNIPALGAALFVGDQLFESAAVGVRANGSAEAVTATDRWHIGSLTKAMTATLAAMLVEDGVMSWETTVGDVFPDFVGVVRSEFLDVRLDELLYHTSGLTTNITDTPSWPNLRTDPAPVTEQRRRWAKELLSIEPQVVRGTYLYTNAGYVVAGAMLEEQTGESWETLMQRELFDALGMGATGFGAPGSAGVRDEPWGHVWQGEAWVAVEPGPSADNPTALGPAGTVHTTFPDFASYVALHLAGARGANGILSAATFVKLHTPAPGTTYALGWGVADRTWAGGRVLQHAGSNTFWFAIVGLAPERDFGVLTVTNVGGNVGEFATDLAIQALVNRFDAAFGGS